MQQAAWFESWFNSPYYHRLYQDRDESEAQAFIKAITDHLKLDPGSRILDLACGKGRHSICLADEGYDVLGIDIAPENILFANQFERDHLAFAVHDMREPLPGRVFDVVLNLFTSFGYFDQEAEHQAALHTMSLALAESGVLVIDYLNSRWVSRQLVAEEQRSIDDVQYFIRRWEDAHHFYKEIEIRIPAHTTPLRFQEKVAKFELADFKSMLEQEGLQIRELFGDYKLHPYDPDRSPRLILLAQRIQGSLPLIVKE